MDRLYTFAQSDFTAEILNVQNWWIYDKQSPYRGKQNINYTEYWFINYKHNFNIFI